MMPTATEARLLALLTEPALFVSPRGAILDANEPARRLLGPEVEDLVSLAVDRARATELLARWARSGSPTPGALELETREGRAWVRMDGGRWGGGEGPTVFLRVRGPSRGGEAFQDLNEQVDRLAREVRRRRSAEQRLAKQVRLLGRIATAEPLAATLDAIARFVEEQTEQEVLASILLVDGDRLHHGAGPSLPASYIEAIDGTEIGPSVGSCGTAAFRREAVVVSDIATDPLWAAFRDVALAHDLRACWSAPVFDDEGRVVATLAHYTRTPRDPRREDHDLTETAIHLVSLAVAKHAREHALRARAEELAERNARIHEFLAMLGHELRNPLSPMATTLELLRSDEVDDAQRANWLGSLERQHGLLRRLVDDLLDMARVSRGKVALRRAPVDVRELVRAACEIEDERIAWSIPDEPLFVDGDPQRLAQVFGNLLHNARKFTPTDGAITVTACRDGDHVLVRVRDDGVGIAPEKLAHVFQLFGQAHESIDRAHGGLGLGLTLARTLIEGHGGRLLASSEGLGRGSEFTVELTAIQPPVDRAVVPRRHDEAPSRLRVLVVDDNEEAAELLASLIERWGHAAEVAFDGDEGLTRARDLQPDAVILDIGLPRLDGYEVASRLSRSPDFDAAGPLLIALTGYGQPHDRERARQAGFDAFLVKPVDTSELQRLLVEHARRCA